MLGKLKPYSLSASIFAFGAFLFVLGSLVFVTQYHFESGNAIEVVKSPPREVVVEVSGAVNDPGVYRLPEESRIEDAIIAAHGLSQDADASWIERNVNRAEVVEDGKKIYIFRQSEVMTASGSVDSNSNSLEAISGSQININIASQSELEGLPGIGPVYAQSIIEHRPYSMVDDLLKTGAIKEHVYDGVKEMISVY